MTNTPKLSLLDAAHQFGVPLRVLRNAIRVGKIPAPADQSATAAVSAEWMASAKAAIKASPKALNRTVAQKVPPFARYDGTSAWRKYTNRVNEYTLFCAA